MKNIDDWWYDDILGLYFFQGAGIGLTWSEVEAIEDDVERHDEKRRTIAERNEY
jgi:hypothetical protein